MECSASEPIGECSRQVFLIHPLESCRRTVYNSVTCRFSQNISPLAGDVTIVPVPSMGDSISEGTVVQWMKQPGDAVEADDVCVVLETDKVKGQEGSRGREHMGGRGERRAPSSPLVVSFDIARQPLPVAPLQKPFRLENANNRGSVFPLRSNGNYVTFATPHQQATAPPSPRWPLFSSCGGWDSLG